MERVTLASRPCGACPYDAVACHLASDLVGCFLVEKGIDIVQTLRCHSVVRSVHMDILSKISLDTFHTHIEERAQQPLIPFCRGGVGEVYRASIVECGEV